MRRVRYKDEGRVRVAHADLPVHFDQGFDGGENEAYCFEWTRPVRKLGQGVQPGPVNAATLQSVTTACEVRGRFNNCDVYVTAPYTWVDPTTLAATDATVRLSLWVLIQGTEYPVPNMTDVDPGTLPGIIIVRGGGGIGDTWRAKALSARGTPCDGYRAKITVTQTTATTVELGQGQVSMFAWGEETASFDAGNIGPIDVTATPALATSGAPLVGVAPTGGTGAQLAAHAAQVQVVLAADKDNAGTIYFGFSAAAVAAMPIQLTPGSTYTLPLSNSNLLWVNSDMAGQTYRVTVT